MKITMLGVGNGFSPGVYDNNALVESDGQYGMIDCGTTAWHSLHQLGIGRDVVDSIFLTHLHFDHSGGVESAALYGKYVLNRKPRLIVPAPVADTLWEHVLRGTIENRPAGLSSLADYFQVETPGEEEVFTLCGSLSAYWMRTKHVEGKFSCGLVMDGRIFYTSDMVNDLALLEHMDRKGIQVIFHDCQLQNAQVHSDFAALQAYPQHLRQKICLMHHGLLNESQAPTANDMKFLFQHREMEY